MTPPTTARTESNRPQTGSMPTIQPTGHGVGAVACPRSHISSEPIPPRRLLQPLHGEPCVEQSALTGQPPGRQAAMAVRRPRRCARQQSRCTWCQIAHSPAPQTCQAPSQLPGRHARQPLYPTAPVTRCSSQSVPHQKRDLAPTQLSRSSLSQLPSRQQVRLARLTPSQLGHNVVARHRPCCCTPTRTPGTAPRPAMTE